MPRDVVVLKRYKDWFEMPDMVRYYRIERLL
jgi:hypothetical protein